MHAFFTKTLLKWDLQHNDRAMPWKGEKDPYRIWISEIILQQTRVGQGMEYYLRFIAEFPGIRQLAKAPEANVYKLWEGLGYYSRCRNLISTARVLDKEYLGKFPSSYEEILRLKGIGPYTAAAISSFAFGLPYAVVDGNVYRIISRFFGISTPVDSNPGKKQFNQLAGELLDKKDPGRYNQAIMDFGAIVCKPASPSCQTCPLNRNCVAFQKDLVDKLPLKTKRISKKERWLYYFVMKYRQKVYIRKRRDRDIWRDLHEFFLIESAQKLTDRKILAALSSKISGINSYHVSRISKVYTQKLTHQHLSGRFVEVALDKPLANSGEFELIHFNRLNQFAFPKFIISYLKEKNVNLSQD